MIKIRYWTIENLNNSQCQKHIIPALIGAGAAIVGGLLSSSGASRKQRRDQDFQREMWQKQVEQQDKVNAQQMAYQDKVNAENREWSRESNVRQRIEAAGYNPYLYNGQASANSVGTASSTNLGNSVTAPTANTSENEYEGIGTALSDVGSIMAQGVKTAQDAYTLSRGKAVDKQNDKVAGVKGGTESKQAQATLEASKQEARVKAATATAQEIQNGLSQMQAYDETGQPLTDESTGRPLTLAQQRARGEQTQLFKSIDKLTQDIVNGRLTEENLHWDALIKQYNFTNLLPEQRDFLHQQIQNLIAEYEKINAETKVLGTQVGLNKSQTRLNNQNVDTQRRYAALLGQQRLTEEQKTAISKIEAIFGSTERAVGIIKNIRPSNQSEVLHYLASGAFSVLTGGDFHSGMSDEQVASKLLDLSHRELAKDAMSKKAKSKMARAK